LRHNYTPDPVSGNVALPCNSKFAILINSAVKKEYYTVDIKINGKPLLIDEDAPVYLKTSILLRTDRKGNPFVFAQNHDICEDVWNLVADRALSKIDVEIMYYTLDLLDVDTASSTNLGTYVSSSAKGTDISSSLTNTCPKLVFDYTLDKKLDYTSASGMRLIPYLNKPLKFTVNLVSSEEPALCAHIRSKAFVHNTLLDRTKEIKCIAAKLTHSLSSAHTASSELINKIKEQTAELDKIQATLKMMETVLEETRSVSCNRDVNQTLAPDDDEPSSSEIGSSEESSRESGDSEASYDLD
jgi:hypothetical protein